MTRKHFEAIAAILKDHKQTHEFGYYADNRRVEVWEDIVEDMAVYFETVNPDFDRDKFITACGL